MKNFRNILIQLTKRKMAQTESNNDCIKCVNGTLNENNKCLCSELEFLSEQNECTSNLVIPSATVSDNQKL